MWEAQGQIKSVNLESSAQSFWSLKIRQPKLGKRLNMRINGFREKPKFLPELAEGWRVKKSTSSRWADLSRPLDSQCEIPESLCSQLVYTTVGAVSLRYTRLQ